MEGVAIDKVFDFVGVFFIVVDDKVIRIEFSKYNRGNVDGSFIGIRDGIANSVKNFANRIVNATVGFHRVDAAFFREIEGDAEGVGGARARFCAA